MFFKTYEVHTCEEGWYVYKQPDNLAVRAIRYSGPHSVDEADKEIDRLDRN